MNFKGGGGGGGVKYLALLRKFLKEHKVNKHSKVYITWRPNHGYRKC